jgi:hypothetical protein
LEPSVARRIVAGKMLIESPPCSMRLRPVCMMTVVESLRFRRSAIHPSGSWPLPGHPEAMKMSRREKAIFISVPGSGVLERWRC